MSDTYQRGVQAAEQDIHFQNWVDGDIARNPEKTEGERVEWQKGYDATMKAANIPGWIDKAAA